MAGRLLVFRAFGVGILFSGVLDLQMRGFGVTPKQISGFDILDVSDRGLEQARFSVEDYENGEISFTCEEVEILSVEQV